MNVSINYWGLRKMLEWLRKKFLIAKDKTPSRPKCDKCGLGAKYHMLIEFKSLDLKELEDKILIKICDGCYDEVYERYNPRRNPPPIQKGVFEQRLGYGKK